jgi:DNA-binding NarL/FixJ family response regulator
VFDSQMAMTLPIAVRGALNGQFSVPREIRAYVHRPALSYREREVVAGVAEGLTNRQIALRMNVSTSTVKAHLGSAFGKLGVRSRKQAAAIVLDERDAARVA